MQRCKAMAIAAAAIASIGCASVHSSRAQTDKGGAPGIGGDATPQLQLTPAQRNAIYSAVSKDRSKSASRQFPAVVGAEVPPMIELYALPDDAVSGNPAAKYYQYTMVQDQVVVVDPTNMRVIDVIGPSAKQ
jgi:Protein of unknown function (DUF1236)